MKAGIHPDYHPVLFVDGDHEWASRSTMTSDEKRVIDGVEHQVVRIEISSFTHPFFTGKQRFIDTAGRIDKFRKKYGG
jgi:large subunit ribosomal protein L31